MRYKSYYKYKGMIDYDQTLYIRHGNNFAGVNYPANLVLKGFKEAKDGVYTVWQPCRIELKIDCTE